MSIKKFPVKILLALCFILFVMSTSSYASEFNGAVMGAYQQAYAMNFEIWKPVDLPAGWYATFDGYPVAQIAENRWVYGQLGLDGAIRPTNILIGSVIPANVPGLLRVAAAGTYSSFVNSDAFRKIHKYKFNSMGWLYDGEINTIIAWYTSKPGIIIWLGDRWQKFTPAQNEYTSQMLKRLKPRIVAELNKSRIIYPSSEPEEVADLARQWGVYWRGRVMINNSTRAFKDSGVGGGSTSFGGPSASTSISHGGNPQNGNQQDSGPQWDVD